MVQSRGSQALLRHSLQLAVTGAVPHGSSCPTPDRPTELRLDEHDVMRDPGRPAAARLPCEQCDGNGSEQSTTMMSNGAPNGATSANRKAGAVANGDTAIFGEARDHLVHSQRRWRRPKRDAVVQQHIGEPACRGADIESRGSLGRHGEGCDGRGKLSARPAYFIVWPVMGII